MKLSRVLCFVPPLVFALTAPVASGDEKIPVTHELKLAVLNARDADTRTAAVRFNFGARQDIDVPTVSAAWFADAKGVVAWKEKANSEGISAELGGEYYKRFGGTVPLNLNQPIDPNAPPPPIAPNTSGTHDFLVGAGLKIGFESDQPFDNNQITVGPRLSFTHTENDGFWPLLPSITLAYQRVHAFRAEQLSQLGVDQRTFWRVDVEASWKWRPFEQPRAAAGSALAPIGLHADVRFFQAHEIPAKLKAVDQDDALYTAGTISYDTERFHWKYVHDIYVTVAHGRIPPSTRDDTTVFLGITFVR